jgi:hypothetical protein
MVGRLRYFVLSDETFSELVEVVEKVLDSDTLLIYFAFYSFFNIFFYIQQRFDCRVGEL